MTHHYYPVALDLRDRRCILVGGGVIAEGKLDGLLAAGAILHVVSPDVRSRFETAAASGRLSLMRRAFQPSDLDGAFIAIAATDDPRVNAEVAAHARARGVLVNAVDDIPNCDFFAVAIVRRGDLQLAVSTNGRSPAFARWMRESLDATLPVEYGALLDVMAEVREEVKRAGPIPPYERWQSAITPEVLEHLCRGDRDRARLAVHATVTGSGGLAIGPAETAMPERIP